MLLNKNNLDTLIRKECLFENREYDVEIKLRAMSLEHQLNIDSDDNNKFFCNVIRFSCIDDQGDYIFDDNEQVKELPANLAKDLFNKCVELNNLGPKSIENNAKN